MTMTMTSGFRHLFTPQERRSTAIVAGIVVLATVLLVVADRYSDRDMSLAPFYLLPAAVAAFVAGHRAGMLERSLLLAQTDSLTGSLNNSAFYEVTAIEITRSQRYRRPLTMLYIDVDDFRAINERLGHEVGDRLLRVVAEALVRSTRTIDRSARLGGDEFAVLLPETDEQAARIVVPRMREALLAAMEKNGWHVTFSIGSLTCMSAPPGTQELIRIADQLMYTVKSVNKDAIGYSVHGVVR